ncbi:hypothetical protein CC80DRAFT_544866 [Byssothecium circinans]|uniref:Uncharacterized protein n=1 Tax=Byssothecium circinans TaxID=147558 RepID=A0A6A5U6U6_9PLEO|nr:hypothetical protein CC80DRAFT_544866 [Byssothecium circinans]
MLSQPLNELDEGYTTQPRMKFTRNLVEYCNRQESRQDEIPSKAIDVRPVSRGGRNVVGIKRSATDTDISGYRQAKRPREQISLDSHIQESLKNPQSPVTAEDMGLEIVQSPYPIKFTDDLVSLLCIGKGQIRRFKKKDSLQKHTNQHDAEGQFRQGF